MSSTAKHLLESNDLFSRTLRTVAILVGACVLFVGSLSAVSVLIASRAMSGSQPAQPADARETPAATTGTAAAPKKPVSI